jgi:hypothetical protein
MLTIAKVPAEMVVELVREAGTVAVPRFMSLTYRNEKEELSTYSLLIGLNMVKAYERDRALVAAFLKRPTLTGLERTAATEIYDSLTESLTKGIGYNSRYAHGPNAADTYISILPGIDVNKSANEEDRGTVYLTAYCQRKTVLEPGEYPIVKHHAKTVAKKAIKKSLGMRTERIRRFKLKKCVRGALNGRTIVLVEEGY